MGFKGPAGLQNDVGSKVRRYEVKCFDFEESQCWMGGSIIGALSDPKYKSMFIDKEQYEEYGPNIVQRYPY